MPKFDLKLLQFLGVFILIALKPQEILSQELKGNEVNQNQCGGPLEADSGFLIYPTPGQTVQPGELCVWTINLQTTKAFTFNFTNLNINSSSNECSDGALRIYSLTNLATTDKLGSHTLCNENPPTGNLFLIENVAAVVFYAGSNPGKETGFLFNWEGTTFNPIPTTHFTNSLTTPSGFIRYPVDGEYEPNTIGTWLVRAGQIDEEINLDFNLTSLSLESCPHVEDPCVCDALILYEITYDGVLTELERFCGEKSSAVKSKIAGNFIIAFYTDLNAVPNSGNGFEVIYKKSTDEVSTTTETPLPSAPCGTIIYETPRNGSAQGYLAYKPGVNYEANERCVWTIRTSPSDQFPGAKFAFTLDTAGFGNEGDKVVVDLFGYFGNGTSPYTAEPHFGTRILTKADIGVTHVEMGTVAIISFTTEGSLGKGFVLSYEITDMECQSTMCQNNTFSDLINAEYQGSIQEIYSQMGDYMLFTYVLPPANFQYTSVSRKISFTYSYIETCSIIECCDAMWVYIFNSQTGLVKADQICGKGVKEFESDDTIIFVFKSDSSTRSNEYEIEWDYGN